MYDNNNNTYMLIYIKKIYAFLIKLSVTTKQFIRSNSICSLNNLAIFFYRVNIEIVLIPPLPLFVFIRSLRTLLNNKPFIKMGTLKEMDGVNYNASAFRHLNLKAKK